MEEFIAAFAADFLVDRRAEEEEKKWWIGGGAGVLGDKSEQCLLHAALGMMNPRRQEEQLQITMASQEGRMRWVGRTSKQWLT